MDKLTARRWLETCTRPISYVYLFVDAASAQPAPGFMRNPPPPPNLHQHLFQYPSSCPFPQHPHTTIFPQWISLLLSIYLSLRASLPHQGFLTGCVTLLCEVFQQILSLSLNLEPSPVLWKISCRVLIPEKKHLNSVAWETSVQVYVHLLPAVLLSAVLLLELTLKLSDEDINVKVTSFSYSHSFSTFWPTLFRTNLQDMQVVSPLLAWITNDFTQNVKLSSNMSDRIVSSMEYPQQTSAELSAPLTLSVHTAHFRLQILLTVLPPGEGFSWLCLCGSYQQGTEGWAQVCEQWCDLNHLHLIITKTKKLMGNFRKWFKLLASDEKRWTLLRNIWGFINNKTKAELQALKQNLSDASSSPTLNWNLHNIGNINVFFRSYYLLISVISVSVLLTSYSNIVANIAFNFLCNV